MKRRQFTHLGRALMFSPLAVSSLTGCAHPIWHEIAASELEKRPEKLLNKVYEAHGGISAWEQTTRIDATLSTSGLAFFMRGQSARVINKKISVFPHEFKTIIYGYPTPGVNGVWENDKVSIISAMNGSVRSTRESSRDHFRYFTSNLAWDDLDLLYFVGYAIWNYLSFPFLLLNKSISIRATESEGISMLHVEFPKNYPTHSQSQKFILKSNGELIRHDYVAEVFSSWASAANFCKKAEIVGGLKIYTHRDVVPAIGHGRSLPFPTLVWIKLNELFINKI